jgi:putative addiction module killer protein
LTTGTTRVTIAWVGSPLVGFLACRQTIPRQYEDEQGRSPYAQWFDDLHAPAAAKVTTALVRLEQGNFSNVKPVGSGVSEYRVDFGPGYRVYFARDGDQIIILLGGGTKKRQQRDINLAIERWQDYKRRKKLGEK